MSDPFRRVGDRGAKREIGPRHGMSGTIHCGDNLEMLADVDDGAVRLAYMDPPFNTKRSFDRHFAARRDDGTDGTVVAFRDHHAIDQEAVQPERARALLEIAPPSVAGYLRMLAPRLAEIRRVLSADGALFLHCDPTASHWVRVLCECIFGPDHFRNEIAWRRTHAHGSARRFAPVHDTIFFFAKGSRHRWNDPVVPYSEEYLRRYFRAEDEGGRYQLITCTAPGDRSGTRAHYRWRGQWPPPGRHWAHVEERMQELESEGRLVYSAAGTPRHKKYVSDGRGVRLTDWWDDISRVDTHSTERVGWETQKPVALLERIILAITEPGDLVLDPFAGSGTSAVAAARHGRDWLLADHSLTGCALALGRLRDDDVTTDIRLRGFPTKESEARALHQAEPHVFGTWGCAMIGYMQDRRHSTGDIAIGHQKQAGHGGAVPLVDQGSLPLPAAMAAIPRWTVLNDRVSVDLDGDHEIVRIPLAACVTPESLRRGRIAA